MGLINAFKTINRINKLVKDLENQIRITQSQTEKEMPIGILQNSLNVHKYIHQELINEFFKSDIAMGAKYTLLGEKMNFNEILIYSKNLIYNINLIIENKKNKY